MRLEIRIRGLLIAGAVLAATTAFSAPRAITKTELVRRTQELMDAVAPGNPAPFRKYFADDCLMFDEKGRSMDKAKLVADVQPLPKGYSGSIRVKNAASRIHGDTAILSYDMDETETIFGQVLTARYHSTDTWMYRKGRWQIIASQVLRYYEDPAAGKSDPQRLADLAGTYELAPGVTMAVTVEDGRLYAQRTGRAREELVPEGGEIFFRRGVEGRRLFHVGENGKVDALIDRRNNEDVIWKKV